MFHSKQHYEEVHLEKMGVALLTKITAPLARDSLIPLSAGHIPGSLQKILR